MNTITKEQRDEIMARRERLMQYCKEQGFTSKSGWTSYKPEQVAHFNPPTNDELAQVELYDFIHDVPDKYFLYVSEKTNLATCFTGLELGKVSFGREWRDNFGGTRRAVTIKAVNGRRYVGTFFKSSGDFARIRLAA